VRDLDEGKLMELFSTRAQAVEYLVAAINALVFERQELRASGAGSGLLERNRLEIVRRQSELSNALIRRHLASPRSASSAG
jgi:hypothetical protein